MSNLVPTLANMPAMPNIPSELLERYKQQSTMGALAETFASTRRVQIRGGVINFLGDDGKPMGNVMSVLPDGTSVVVQFPQMATSADIVIVQQFPAGRTSYRQWFASEYSGDDDAAKIPACWSADGVEPSPNSANPQSAACETCPKNISGSSKTGKGKACSSRKRLAVYLAADPERRLFQLDLPTTACFGKSSRESEGYFTLAKYAQFLQSHNSTWEWVSTTIAFTELSQSGSALLRFKCSGWLDLPTIDATYELAKETSTLDLIKVDYRKPEKPATAQPEQDPKQAVLANPYLPPHMREWAQHPAVTLEMIRAEALKVGVVL